jgi:uncharacterized membrane protein
MSWIIVGLLASAVAAFVSILDKRAIYRYANSSQTVPLLVGISQTTVGVLILAIVGVPSGTGSEVIIYGLLSGVLFGFSGSILLRILYSQEVSRTIPVTQSYPIFAALIALAFLGEEIAFKDWGAILATVAGATCLSLRRKQLERSIILDSSFFWLMLSAMIMAVAWVLGKLAVDENPVLFVHGLRMLMLGIVFLVINARRKPWLDIRDYLEHRSPALLLVGFNEFLVANLGQILLLWALSLGPVSLVSALLGVRSLFVLILSAGISFVWKGSLGEDTSSTSMAVKLGATVLIVSGVGMITI